MGDDAISTGAMGELRESLRVFLRFEQQNLWRAGRFRYPSAQAGAEAWYLPERSPTFRLPCFRVRRKHVYVYGKQDSADGGMRIVEGDGADGTVLFPIHPAELGHYREFLDHVRAEDAAQRGVCLWATPTSSTRTLVVWPEGRPDAAVFAKLSLQSHLLGDRRLTRGRVAGSVGLSSLVQQCRGELPLGVSFLPESLGFTPRYIPESGVVFRFLPEEIRDGTVLLAPIFALMGGSVQSPSLLVQLLENGRSSTWEALREMLLSGFARIWVDLVFDLGLILEAHGQDLLLGLAPDLAPKGGFYYRDFEGLTVDWGLRRARGIRDPECMPHASEWFCTYETWGYPLYQLVSHKLLISLFDYLHLFLVDLESVLRSLPGNGVTAERCLQEGTLTYQFSYHLRNVIYEKFGMREAHEYDVHSHLARFVKFLMRVRGEIVGGRGP